MTTLALLKRLLSSNWLILALCAALIVIAAPLTPGFASNRNLAHVLTVASPLLILALGQMLVMIGGGIDLSMTAILAVTSVWGASLVSADGGPLAGSAWAFTAVILAMPVIGAGFGLINGMSVAWLRLPPFIATLTSMMFGYGLATWWTQSENIGGLPARLVTAGTSAPIVIGIAVVVTLLVGKGLRGTVYGRWLIASGENPRTALVSGVPVRWIVAATYGVGGGLAGLASIVYTAELESGSPVLGKSLLLDIIGAVVIGGTSLFGGKGKVTGTVGGVLFMTLLDNVLTLQNLSHFSVMIAKGALILTAAAIDSLRNHWSSP